MSIFARSMVVVAMVTHCWSNVGLAQDAGKDRGQFKLPGGTQRQPDDGQVLCYVARNIPASELGQTVEQALGRSGVRVVASDLSNCIVVTASAEQMKTVSHLLKQLDRDPLQFEFEVILVSVKSNHAKELAGIEDPVKAATLVNEIISKREANSVDRFKLSSVENQKAQVQTGTTRSILTGRSSRVPSRGGFSTSSGRLIPTTNTYTQRDFGTIVQVVGRGVENAIRADVAIESSGYDDPKPVASDNQEGNDVAGATSEFKPGKSHTTQISTTVSLKDGQSILLSSALQPDRADGRQLVVLLTARIAKSGKASKNSVARKPASRSKEMIKNAETKVSQLVVFRLKFADVTTVQQVLAEVFKGMQIRIQPDARTNSLIVTASEETTLKQIEQLLRVLDTNGKSGLPAKK